MEALNILLTETDRTKNAIVRKIRHGLSLYWTCIRVKETDNNQISTWMKIKLQVSWVFWREGRQFYDNEDDPGWGNQERIFWESEIWSQTRKISDLKDNKVN